MKNLFLLALLSISFNSFAKSADYVCDVQQYRLQVTLTEDLSTSMWLTDQMSYDTISQGFAGWIEKKGSNSIYHFYPSGADEVQLTFKTQNVVDLPDRMSAYIETRAHGFLLWDNMTCAKVQD